MKRYNLVPLILILTMVNSFSQNITKDTIPAQVKRPSAQATNISATLDNAIGAVFISYDLVAQKKSKRYKVDLQFSENYPSPFSPYLTGVTGDIGYNVKPGRGKVINWAYFIDAPAFKGQDVVFKFIVQEDHEYRENRILGLGGPEKFYQSLLIPGLGNYYVRGGRGYAIITCLVAGLLGTGGYYYYQSEKYFDQYLTSTDASSAHNNFDKASKYHDISNSLFFAGGTVWAIDFGQVLIKGISNRAQQKKIIKRRQQR